MFSQGQATVLYNVARKWLTITSVALFPVMLNIDLVRFAPSVGGVHSVGGPAWSIAMELAAPILLVYAFVASPLSFSSQSAPPLNAPQIILAALYVAHFINSVLLILREPSSSKTHTLFSIAAVVFHALNGWVIGAYLTSPFARIYLTANYTFGRSSFYLGVALWALGLGGNIIHNNISVRTRGRAKGKGREDDGQARFAREHHAIPYGGLYKYISYPQYLCEWIEWLGFALAAAPPPPLASASVRFLLSPRNIVALITTSAYLFAPNLAPPYILLLAEVLSMLPHAYRGHKSYRSKFGDLFPKDRKAVIPFVF